MGCLNRVQAGLSLMIEDRETVTSQKSQYVKTWTDSLYWLSIYRNWRGEYLSLQYAVGYQARWPRHLIAQKKFISHDLIALERSWTKRLWVALCRLFLWSDPCHRATLGREVIIALFNTPWINIGLCFSGNLFFSILLKMHSKLASAVHWKHALLQAVAVASRLSLIKPFLWRHKERARGLPTAANGTPVKCFHCQDCFQLWGAKPGHPSYAFHFIFRFA